MTKAENRSDTAGSGPHFLQYVTGFLARTRLGRTPLARTPLARTLLVALVAAGLLAAPLAASAQPTPPASLLFFNDAHDIGPVLSGGQDRGGVARLKTAIDGVRSTNPATRVLFGGDLAGGTLFGGLYKGAPQVEAFNRIGIDLAGFGQHDFDFGVDNTRQLMAQAEFPWISTNLVDAADQPFSEDGTYSIQRLGRLRVAVLSLTDNMDTSGATSEVQQQDVIAAAKKTVADMRRHANADLVIAMTQQALEPNKALLAAVPEIDGIFTEEMAEYDSVITDVGGRFVMAPEGNIGSMIRLDIAGTPGHYTLTPSVIEVDDTVTPDPELWPLEQQYAAEMEQNLSTELATLTTPLLDPDQASRTQETNVGNFVADAYREAHDTDIGWMNGGGIRAEAKGKKFTKRDAYSIVPFANKVIKIKPTGAQISEALEQAVAQVETKGGGFPQVSGVTYSYSPTAPAGSRVSDVQVGGAPIDPLADYTLAVTNYVAEGGDGVTALQEAPVEVPALEAPTDAEAVVAHASKLKTINIGIEGRITVLS